MLKYCLMRIEEKDCLEAYYFLQYEQQRGMEWLLYKEEQGAVQVAGMFCFPAKEELEQFKKQYPDFTQGSKDVSLGFVLDMMAEVMLVQEELKPANISIKTFIESKLKIMNNENAEYLQKQVKYAGFGEDLNRAIVNELKNDPGEFKLNYTHTFGKDTMDAELNFKRSKESDLYFFNSYDVTMKREGKPDVSNTFFINQGQSITLREAYNLMNGRSVEKEFTRKMNAQEKEQYKAEFKLDPSQRGLPENWDKAPTYKAWIKLDLQHRDEHGNLIAKQYHQNFGFDLERSLAKLPLRKMDASQEHEMLLSLKKGNITPVQFTVEGVDKKMLLAADPQFKAITVYDDAMQLARKETYSQSTKKDNEGQAVTEQKSNEPVQDKATVKEAAAVQQDVVQQPAKVNPSDLVSGPEAPWEGKKTKVAQQPAEEKKTEVSRGVKEEQGVAKKDLLGKGKEKNGLLPQKEKQGESKKMKVA